MLCFCDICIVSSKWFFTYGTLNLTFYITLHYKSRKFLEMSTAFQLLTYDTHLQWEEELFPDNPFSRLGAAWLITRFQKGDAPLHCIWIDIWPVLNAGRWSLWNSVYRWQKNVCASATKTRRQTCHELRNSLSMKTLNFAYVQVLLQI